jgi:hypothetical protein
VTIFFAALAWLFSIIAGSFVLFMHRMDPERARLCPNAAAAVGVALALSMLVTSVRLALLVYFAIRS